MVPIIVLAQAQLLRAWERYDSGDILAAVRDMLRVDRFGHGLDVGAAQDGHASGGTTLRLASFGVTVKMNVESRCWFEMEEWLRGEC